VAVAVAVAAVVGALAEERLPKHHYFYY